MKKILFIFLFGIFFISLISASGIQICIDHIPPSAPSNLIITSSGNNVQLNWNSAVDEPSCSGISHYDIYRSFNNGNFTSINNFTTTTNYLDNIPNYGLYKYIIHAWDLAGHNEGNGVSNSITLTSAPVNPGSSGGGGGIESYWKCGGWSSCIANSNFSLSGIQTRICTDIQNLQPNRTESKICSSDFVPLKSGNSTSFGSPTSLTNTTKIDNKSKIQSSSFLTGAVAGVSDFAKSEKGIGIIFILLVVSIGLWIFLLRNKKLIRWIKKHR